MPGTNACVQFGFDKLDAYSFEELPKGTFFTLRMNPYNGLVLLSYQRNDVCIEVIEDILMQMRETTLQHFGLDGSLSDYLDLCKLNSAVMNFEPCPFCGGVPSYVPDEPVDIKLIQTGLFSGHIECCAGRTHVEGFNTKLEAVSYWNRRVNKLVVA